LARKGTRKKKCIRRGNAAGKKSASFKFTRKGNGIVGTEAQKIRNRQWKTKGDSEKENGRSESGRLGPRGKNIKFGARNLRKNPKAPGENHASQSPTKKKPVGVGTPKNRPTRKPFQKKSSQSNPAILVRGGHQKVENRLSNCYGP